MATKKMKINFKMPTPTAAERLHAQQQKNRKAAGLPDPSEYKKKLDSMKSEEVEQLDEISPQLKASYVAGAKKQIKQSLPFTKKTDEYRDIAKNFIAKRQKGIAKASKVEEQLEKKGRFVSGPIKQPFKSDTILTSVKEGFKMGRGNVHEYDRNPGPKDGSELENVPFHAKTEKQKKLQNALTDLGKKMKETHPKLREAKDSQEYDYEGDMAKSDLRSIMHNAKELHDMIEDNTNLAEWCQSKITLAEDYLTTVTNYMRSEMNEEVKKNEYHIAGKHKFPTNNEHAVTVKHTESGREHVHSGKGKYLSKLIKTRYNINHYFEEVELDEAKKMEYNQKDVYHLQGCVRELESMKKQISKLAGNHDAVFKTIDKAIDVFAKEYTKHLNALSAGRGQDDNFRVPEMFSKLKFKKEEVELHDVPFNKPYNKDSGTTTDKSGAKHTPMSKARHLARQALSRTSSKPVKEDVATNRPQPTLPSMSSDQAVANAQNAVQREKKRLDLLKAKDKTSSYETQQRQKTTPIVNNNGSLSMKKESASEPTEGEMKNKQQNYSRKAQIVRDAAGKSKKSDSPEKFQKDPELSSEIHKT